MNILHEALSDFTYRRELLEGLLLPEVSGIIVTYAVTEDQLFEEALLRRHYFPFMSLNATTVVYRLLVAIEAANHALARTYMTDLNLVDMRPAGVEPVTALDRLTHALKMDGSHGNCYRLRCYYDRGICKCQRPFIPPHIAQGLVMAYF